MAIDHLARSMKEIHPQRFEHDPILRTLLLDVLPESDQLELRTGAERGSPI